MSDLVFGLQFVYNYSSIDRFLLSDVYHLCEGIVFIRAFNEQQCTTATKTATTAHMCRYNYVYAFVAIISPGIQSYALLFLSLPSFFHNFQFLTLARSLALSSHS